eukprot:GHVS01001018.1.p1 GENE.GHVS01001018.1~~GHVS01001018.1.p1  ORF type:complete len:239 (+),score=4.28 GHVS01001018.1:399-1115(+)
MKFGKNNCWKLRFSEINFSFPKICCRTDGENDQARLDTCEWFKFELAPPIGGNGKERKRSYFATKKGSEDGQGVLVSLYSLQANIMIPRWLEHLTNDLFKGQPQLLEVAQILSLYGKGDEDERTGSPVVEIALFTFCAFQSFGDDLIQIVSLLNIEGLSFTIKPSMHGGPPYFYCSWNSHATKRSHTFIDAMPVFSKYRLQKDTGAPKLRNKWKMKVVKAIKTQCDKELEDIRKAVAP